MAIVQAIRSLLLRSRNLVLRKGLDRDLDDELAAHLDLHIADNLRAGMSPAEARRQALLKLGGVQQTKESYRDLRGFPLLENLLQDLRFALRIFRKSPGFSAVVVLTLALGIGASTAIFSLVYNGVLYPFPYRSAERLTAINIVSPKEDFGRGMYHLDEVAAFRERNHSFEDILAYGLWYMTYSHGTDIVMVKAVGATPNAMEFWGMRPALGRGFTESDAGPTSPPVVLLNYLYWKKEFHGDANALGRTMMLNGKARTVIGVMPPRFQYVGADMYLPVSWTRPEPDRGRFEFDLDDPYYFWATGILKREVSLPTAAADIDVIARQLATIHPDEYPKEFRVETKKLNDVILGDFKKTLLLLVAAVGLLLFISTSNVAGLRLAQASARTKEIALRSAVGATGSRIVQQLLSESLVLGTAGCITGCALAYTGLKLITLAPLASMVPVEASITLNRPVLLFAVAISFLATLLCGLAPALHAAGSAPRQGLASTGFNVNSSFQYQRFRSGLVVGQVVLSLVLLTFAGLVAKRYWALTHVDLGIQPDRIFAAMIHFPKGRYETARDQTAFFDRLLPEVNAIPGVTAAAEMFGFPPPLHFTLRSDVTIPGKPHSDVWPTSLELCSEGYFKTLAIHLLRGRLLDPADISAARQVIVVNETLARKYFEGADAIGRQIKFNDLDQYPQSPHDAYFEIVGVVSDSSSAHFDAGVLTLDSPKAARPESFAPASVSGFGVRTVAVQTQIPPAALTQSIRKILWSIDHDAVLVAPQMAGAESFSLADIVDNLVYGKPRFTAIAFSACASLGFALALVGLFSVMTYIVSLQTHDLGVRLALGAPRAAVLKLILKRGMLLIATGIAIGSLASVALARVLASQVRGVSGTDPTPLALVVALVTLAGLAACLLPSWRAASVEPTEALRYE
jgi:putative ABC transport system permease protein